MATRTSWATRLPTCLVDKLIRQWPRVHSLSDCADAECGTCSAIYAARLAVMAGREPPQGAWDDEARAVAAAYVAGLPIEALERIELYVLGDLSVSDEEMSAARKAAACGGEPQYDAYPALALRALLDATLGSDPLADADRDDLESVSSLVDALVWHDGHDPESARPIWVEDEEAFLGVRMVFTSSMIGEWDRGGRALAGVSS